MNFIGDTHTQIAFRLQIVVSVVLVSLMAYAIYPVMDTVNPVRGFLIAIFSVFGTLWIAEKYAVEWADSVAEKHAQSGPDTEK